MISFMFLTVNPYSLFIFLKAFSNSLRNYRAKMKSLQMNSINQTKLKYL